MAQITIGTGELYSRGSSVQELLRRLSKVESGPAYRMVGSATVPVIGTHDGSPPSSSYTEWRFATRFPRFRASYFEVWRLSGGASDQYDLSKAYLHLFLRGQHADERELLALHCDPADQPDEHAPHLAKYKNGPHIHVTASNHPIPKAHIALALTNLAAVLATATALTEALSQAIELIADEVLGRYV